MDIGNFTLFFRLGFFESCKTKRYKSYVDEEVKLLTVGGEILGRNGTEVTVVSLRVKKEKQLMYSLEFADNPIAFEANGVLVGQE